MKIASKENVKTASANLDVDRDKLFNQTELQAPGCGIKTTYTVAGGDTDKAIALAFGIALSILSACNSSGQLE